MTTKNFYECDSIAAMLLYSLMNNNLSNAVYAAREIYASEEHELLSKLLTFTWFLQTPYMEREHSIYNAFLKNDNALLLQLLCKTSTIPELPTVYSLKPPKPSGKLMPPPQWSPLPLQWSYAAAGTLWKAVQDAIRHTNYERAAMLVAPLISENLPSAVSLLECVGLDKKFTELLPANLYTPLSYRILMHGFAVLCSKPASSSKFIAKQSLSSVCSGRTARQLHIQMNALNIWHVRAQPPTRLLGAPVSIVDDTATAVWSKLVEKFGIYIENNLIAAKDSDSLEAFYVAGFPDDIPDEWSTEERKKSHYTLSEAQVFEKNPWVPAFILCWS